MDKTKMTAAIKSVRTVLSQHSPEILTGIGIAGMITSTVLAVRATPKAVELIKYDSERNHDGDPYAYTKVEAVKSCWKCYIPAAITGTTAVACLVGASSVNLRRNSALAAAYKLSETALNDYREKVVETIGEKKEQVIRDKVAKEQLDKHPTSKSDVIVTGNGNTQCFDPLSGRYFMGSIERIKKAEINLNKRMIHEISGYISVNEFYDEIGLPHTAIGYELGWNTDNLIELDIGAQPDENDVPTLVIGHYKPPVPNYRY